MHIACLDLEGVLVPEVWINVAHYTGIDELKKTTRDIPDYDVLMKRRLQILHEHNLKLCDIQKAITKMKPLKGAVNFLNWLRKHFQVIILSDTFYEFAGPLLKQLDYPTLLCHSLATDEQGRIVNYLIRLHEQKRISVEAFKNMNFKVIAVGDSYNDTTMLATAHCGVLFRPSKNVMDEFPQFTTVWDYSELKKVFIRFNEQMDSDK
jgi:phosphoserine / homoserine phosphotransferase